MFKRISILTLALILMTFALSESEGLTFDASTLTDTPAFLDWTQDGTAMQLIALKGADGQIRLALNTCQSCNGSPWAWFELLPDGCLQCQNCGQIFTTDAVGTAHAAGCSPITLTEFTQDGDVVTVPEALLRQAAPLFANWKQVP